MSCATRALLPLAILCACLAAAGPALAADRVVSLTRPKPIRKDLQAFPRIAHPIDLAEQRINAALTQLDNRVRKSAATCKGEDGKPGDWERSIDVPMTGPGFVSYSFGDSMYCGGAYPDFESSAIVYDLKTGRPVDWTDLLPPTLTGKVELAPQPDGARMVTLASKRLNDLFLAGYDRQRGDDPECKAAVRSAGDTGLPPMTVWLDSKLGGLVVQVHLRHAVQACGEDIVIPTSVLRDEGAKPALLTALSAAHKS